MHTRGSLRCYSFRCSFRIMMNACLFYMLKRRSRKKWNCLFNNRTFICLVCCSSKKLNTLSTHNLANKICSCVCFVASILTTGQVYSWNMGSLNELINFAFHYYYYRSFAFASTEMMKIMLINVTETHMTRIEMSVESAREQE